jgi:hypothetical protein
MIFGYSAIDQLLLAASKNDRDAGTGGDVACVSRSAKSELQDNDCRTTIAGQLQLDTTHTGAYFLRPGIDFHGTTTGRIQVVVQGR